MAHVPDIHPLIVHFPIALLSAALVLDLAGLFSRRRDLGLAARWMLWLGTFTAGFAVWSGHEAAEAAAPYVNATAAALIRQHHNQGMATLGGAAALSLWRLVASDVPTLRWRAIYVGSFAAVVVNLVVAAHVGGELVFVHGVAVHARATSFRCDGSRHDRDKGRDVDHRSAARSQTPPRAHPGDAHARGSLDGATYLGEADDHDGVDRTRGAG
jgi:uncharacterized membrane protein